MIPELKKQVLNNSFKTIKKIDDIFSKYQDDRKMDIKDLEDLRRLSEILDNLTNSLAKNLYW